MSVNIVQNQQLKPIGDKVPIDTTLSSSSENAISNKAVSDAIDNALYNYEVLVSGDTFGTFSVDYSDLNQGDKLHIIVINNSVRFIMDLVVGVDLPKTSQTVQYYVMPGQFVSANQNETCSLKASTSGVLSGQAMYHNATLSTGGNVYILLYRNPFYPQTSNTRSIPETNVEEEPVVEEETNEEEQR